MHVLCKSVTSGLSVSRLTTGKPALTRDLATSLPITTSHKAHRVIVIGGGSAGIAISHQLLRWTLVGGGLREKEDCRRPLAELIEPKLKFYNTNVAGIHPTRNSLVLGNGDTINFEHLVIAPGVKVDFDSVAGLEEAMDDPDSLVASIYSYGSCDKVYRNLKRMKQGTAIFTQPAGVVKCAGAPQKIMWLAWDHWMRAGLYQPDIDQSAINITFATGLPMMFGVPKYIIILDELRKQRGVEGLFEHDLVSIEGKTATFVRPGGAEQVKRHFDFLHVAPKNVPHAFVKESGLCNDAGFVDVDPNTLRHEQHKNIWSLGDASGLPTSKTVAAITAQTPTLAENIMRALDGKEPSSEYDGYTSCPLLTSGHEVLLAEFKYGGVPKETFNDWFGIDQSVPRRAFFHLKKYFFPWVYDRFHVKGQWGGPKGWIR